MVAVEAGRDRHVVPLGRPEASGRALTGGKAAGLARAAAAGLPVLPGFALPPATARVLVRGAPDPLRADVTAAVARAWSDLSGDGRRALAVRSSSVVEDTGGSSMAGRFTSVLDVRGWNAFLDAVAKVVGSAALVESPDRAPDGRPEEAPMAVLVQPFVEADVGGVMFGVDPVTGDRDRVVVAAVPGSPARLVGGSVDGHHLVLTRRGSLAGADRPAARLVGPILRRRLAVLARRAAEAFGAPQDVEWAVAGGELFLLQSRPVTAAGPAGTPSGPVLGPGPVAETFPAPLAALEEDLWVEPLRRALGEVLLLTGAASRRRVEASPIVRTVAGRVAADLELLGLEERTGRRRWLARLDPRPPARRLRAAWRVGRLRVALPGLGRDLVREVDRQLAEVPRPRELDLATLRRVLGRCREALVAVHGHEVLAGRLLDDGEASATAASAALRVLAEHAGAGTPDEELVARFPVLLALVPPAVGRPVTLPPAPAGLPAAATSGEDAGLREALRLRARWLHELSARVALEIGRRLAAANRLPEPASVRHLTLDRLDALLAGRVAVDLAGGPGETEAPLPARFRLTDAGAVLPLADGPGDRAGRGAGGGRGSGTVRGLGDLPAGGSVLVVGTLDPDLAPHLPGLAGLVAETGSPLSHLAILARELGVPVAVGVRGARDRFPPGTRVVVDGTTGEVIVAPEEAPVP